MVENEKLLIRYNEKIYHFSISSLILYPIGTILLTFFILFFFNLPINLWFPEIVAKQSAFLLNSLFDLDAEVFFYLNSAIPWKIGIPDSITISISPDCTGITAMSIFTSIIIFTPHSQNPETNRDILRRKIIDAILTIFFIYIFNIVRIVVIAYFYHLGVAWSVIHDSLANLSTVVVVHIFIFVFCNKFIPEWYISIYYVLRFVIYKLKKN